jgi:hypothetical protein
MYGDVPLADNNAALIVAAVNDYDRLRAIEDAARKVCESMVSRPDVEDEIGMTALREALR